MMRESGAAEKPLRPDGVAPKAGANLDRPERHDAQPARSPQPRGAARLGYPDDLQRPRNRRPGSARDLDAMASGFFVLAGSIMPSHAHVHLVEFGGTVTVGGMVVSPNDIIHADRHGAVVIPPEAVGKIPEAIDLLTRREKVLIEASKQPGFSVDRLRQAYREQDEIH